MPDDKEVRYSYTGDVSSLEKATLDAIDLLGKYQESIKQAAQSDSFKASKTSLSGFNSTLSGINKQVNTLVKSLNKMGAPEFDAMKDQASSVSKVVKDLSDVLELLDSGSATTSEDFKLMASVLKDTRKELEATVSKAYALSTAYKPLSSLNIQAQPKQQEAAASTSPVATKDYSALIGQAKALAYAQSLEAQLNQTKKSAAESAAAFNQLLTAADKAKQIGTFGSTIGTVVHQVNNLKVSVAGLMDYMRQRLNQAAEYFSPVTNKVQSMYNSTKNVLTKTKKVFSDFASALRRQSKEADSAEPPVNRLNESMKRLMSTFKQSTPSVSKLNSGLGNLQHTTNLLSTAFRALVGVNIAKWLSQSANQSISYAENLNLFTVATGEAFEESYAFIKQMQELYGMDPSNLMRYAGNFYQLADAIDVPDKAAANLSLGLTKATNDIASLFNVDIETVFENLSSGMQGMSRAVRKYGMDIRTTTLQATAAAYGLTESVENMSEANRQALRFITMMKQASNANGDFARTIESPANQLRIFKEQMSQLGRAIGDMFIGPLTVAIQYINGFVMALRMVISFIGSILGVTKVFSSTASTAQDAADNVASSIGGVGGAASDAAKELKAFLAPFDELTVLEAPDLGGSMGGGGGGLGDLGTLDPALEEALANMAWKLDEVKMKAVEVRDAILEFFGFKVEDGTILDWDASVFEENLINKFPQWTATIQAVFDNWSSIIDGFKAVFISMGDVLTAVWRKITDFIKQFVNDDSVSTFINNLATNLQNLATWISANADGIANFIIAFATIRGIASFIPTILNFADIFKTLATYIPMVASVLSSITAPVAVVAAGIGLIVFTIADLLATNEEFRNLFIDAWNSLTDVLSDLWNNLLKPIFDELVSTLKSIYESTIKPLVQDITTLLLSLWNDILAPLLSWLISALGPSISDVCSFIASAFEIAFNVIGTVIRAVIQVLQGLITFISGVFSGDWSKVWEGIVQIFSGIFNAIAGIVVAVMNAVIMVINGVISLVYNAVVGLINLVLEAVNKIGSALGFSMDLGITASAPQIPYMPPPSVAMANGGVVTGPTNALIGEGRYDEAVIPLGNSPQMNEFADNIAARMNSDEQILLLREQNSLLRQILEKTGVSIDGRKVSDMVSTQQRQRSRALGV